MTCLAVGLCFFLSYLSSFIHSDHHLLRLSLGKNWKIYYCCSGSFLISWIEARHITTENGNTATSSYRSKQIVVTSDGCHSVHAPLYKSHYFQSFCIFSVICFRMQNEPQGEKYYTSDCKLMNFSGLFLSSPRLLSTFSRCLANTCLSHGENNRQGKALEREVQMLLGTLLQKLTFMETKLFSKCLSQNIAWCFMS